MRAPGGEFVGVEKRCNRPGSASVPPAPARPEAAPMANSHEGGGPPSLLGQLRRSKTMSNLQVPAPAYYPPG